MGVQRLPHDDSREAGDQKSGIPQPDMNFLEMRNPRQASVAPLNVFFGWIHSLKM